MCVYVNRLVDAVFVVAVVAATVVVVLVIDQFDSALYWKLPPRVFMFLWQWQHIHQKNKEKIRRF